MGLRDCVRRFMKSDPGPGEVHVGDPRFDDWAVVRDFEDAETAKAWREQLASAGYDAALTADWPLDRFGRGDIALRVPGDQWSDAEALLSNLD
jgi:hypothetical protein